MILKTVQLPDLSSAKSTKYFVNNILLDSLIPLNFTHADSPISPLICIGQNLSIVCESIPIDVMGIFLSPLGQTVIILLTPPSDEELPSIIAQFRTWNYRTLDLIAAEYTYETYGQASRIIDLMAKHGYLNFSDSKRLADNLKHCMKSGNFNLLCIDKAAV